MDEEVIKKRMSNKNLSKYACNDDDAILLKNEPNDIRPRFFRDADRIIYSLSYTRYIDKTQVFAFSDNDNISKRMTHVQFVSKIARTIGRALGLNEDLIEAASLGHDLGHPPFGHPGETILNEISLKHNEGVFAHNIQSVRTLLSLENNGLGKNISIQVLDAIMCHNGEMIENIYNPIFKTKEEFLNEYENSYKDKNISKKLKPMTLEGCVVRISDVIGYIGRDIEDAIRLNMIKIDDVPKSIVNVLGTTNREIVNSIVLDIINNSYDKPYIKLSEKVFIAIKELLNFNYEYIYHVTSNDEELKKYEDMYETLFKTYMKALEDNNKSSDIYTAFLNDMSKEYLNSNSNARKVIDYISGMTDDYFINRYKEIKKQV